MKAAIILEASELKISGKDVYRTDRVVAYNPQTGADLFPASGQVEGISRQLRSPSDPVKSPHPEVGALVSGQDSCPISEGSGYLAAFFYIKPDNDQVGFHEHNDWSVVLTSCRPAIIAVLLNGDKIQALFMMCTPGSRQQQPQQYAYTMSAD